MGFGKLRTEVLHTPNTELLGFIKNKLGEDDEKLEYKLTLLYQWLDSYPEFPKNYDRNKIKNFMRACNYDMEKCKKKLECQFFIRHEFPHVFSNLNPRSKELSELSLKGNCLFLPNLTPNGDRLFVLGVNDMDVENFDVTAFVKYSFMCYDLVLRTPYPVSGDIMILDGNGFTMKHFLKCINTAVKDSIEIASKGYMIRLKAIYVVNAPNAVDKMVATWKLFLTEKLKNRVVVSKSCDIVQNAFPSHCLPEDFGGTLPNLRHFMQNWYNYLLQNSEWFQDQENCKCTERPNIGKREYDDRFGVEGSFRKLTID